eukprot:5087039-Alexandrium_andersonii.AAC.1
MSASLVGSEMCIRDRAWPPLVRCDACWPQRRPPRGVRRSADPYLQGDGPVSYTHLTLPTICSV